MLAKNWKAWGRVEYFTPPPRWLQFALLLVAVVALGSDISFIRNRPWDSLTAWILLEAIFTYAAIGFSLISAQASVILCLLAMGTSFATQRPAFALIAVCTVALAISALCKICLTSIHCCISVVWVTLISWFTHIVEINNPITFWWTAFLLLLASVLIGLAIRYLVIRTARIQATLREIETRQEETRQEERRELHDVVAHHITIITMQIAAHGKTHDPDQLHDLVEIISDSSHKALTELRSLLTILRDDENNEKGQDSGQVAAGPNVGEQIEHNTRSLAKLGFQVHTEPVDPRIESLPFLVKNTCVRIVQESTTNIIKHARHGARCSIALTLDPTELTISIINNRPKANEKSTSSYGLTGLQERIAAVGGRYVAERHEDEWVVEARLPIHALEYTDPSPKMPEDVHPAPSGSEKPNVKEEDTEENERENS